MQRPGSGPTAGEGGARDEHAPDRTAAAGHAGTASAPRIPRPAAVAAVAVAAALAPLALPDPPPAGVYALGVVAGAALALQAAGLILVHRAQRFLNIAQVQFGAVAAGLFTALVHAQPLVRGAQSLCPPCIEQVSPGVANVNYALSAVLSLAGAGIVAWLAYTVVFRRVAGAPRLVLTVASIFLAQVLAALDDVLPRILSTEDQRAAGLAVRGPAPLPFDVQVRVGGVVLHAADLLLVLAAAASLAGIAAWLRRTRAGTAMRAAAERPERAASLGIDVARVNGRVWLLAGALSGVGAVLTAMTVGSGAGGAATPVSVLVRVLAVAVVARLSHLGVAAAAAVAVGVADQVALATFHTTDAVDAALVLVVGAVLLARRRQAARPDDDGGAWRATREARPVPAALRAHPVVRAWARTGAALLAVVLLGLPWVLAPAQAGLLTLVVLEAVVGLSLLVLTGWAGRVSLGQVAFAAVGAWAAAACRLPLPLAVLVGAGVAAAVAVAVGIPALRLSGIHLAVTTLALALAAPVVLFADGPLAALLPGSVARPSPVAGPRAFYYLALAVLAAAVAAVARLRRTRTGRALIAARDNEAAAQSFGIDLARARLGAFAVSGALAGLAGGLVAFLQGSVEGIAFTPEASLRVFTFTVIGGLGSLAGPLLGFAYAGVLMLFGASRFAVLALSGGGGLVLLLLMPGGLAAAALDLRDGALRRLARSEQAARDRVAAPIAPNRRLVTRRYDIEGQWLTRR